MLVVQINTVYNRGSTGKIAYQIQRECTKQGIDNVVAYRYDEGGGNKGTYCISTWLDCHMHNRIAKYTHRIGHYSKMRTARFIRYLEQTKPDVIHIHNLHGAYINVKMLFDYIERHGIKVLWTFHDCWPFTGFCPYFEVAGCNEWQTGCKNCCYGKTILNKHSAERNLREKQRMVENVDLTIVTPSYWLANIVKQTFYSRFGICVVPNGIDLSVFRPRKSDFRKQYRIPDSKYILLGVAADWGVRKGLDVFIGLADRLNSEIFQIILVGTTSAVDEQLPESIISIHRTNDQIELAEIYTAADLFINPTREEVLGMVNIEANACGTPVVTYDTGGSPECISQKSGIVVGYDDIDALEKAILAIQKRRPVSSQECVENAGRFDCRDRFRQYVEIYEKIWIS